MKQFRNLTWAVIASMSMFSACSNVEDEEEFEDLGPTIEYGTEANPYNVAQVIKMNPGSTAVKTGVWAEGYIVGVREYNAEGAGTDVFGKQESYAYNANVYLADTEGETNYKNCISVQITPNYQAALGLMTNPGNYGKKLSIQGDVIRYNSVPGIKNPTAYKLDGVAGVTPDAPAGKIEVCGDASDAVASLFYDFQDQQHNVDFTKEGWQSAVLQGDRQWRGAVHQSNGYIKATAHGATDGKTYESWVISPALDLEKAASKTVSFKTAQAFWRADTKFEVYALQCVDGTTVQTLLNGSYATSTTTEYEFVESGDIDLSQFSGVVYIGFRYVGMGGQSKSTTWCVDDFNFGQKASTETTVSIKYGSSTVETGAEFNCEIVATVNHANGVTVITATGVPAWATFADNGDGTASIKGTAPAAAEESTIVITATNNGVEATKTFTLKVVEPIQPGDALLRNGGFETWGETAPANWTLKTVDGVTYSKETTIVKEGTAAVKVVSGASAKTANISAVRVKLEPGVYTYSFDYYLDESVTAPNTFRSWAMLYDNETTTTQSTDTELAELKKVLQPTGYVSTEVKGAWATNTITFEVPKTCYAIFEVRVYKGTTGYVDNVVLAKN